MLHEQGYQLQFSGLATAMYMWNDCFSQPRDLDVKVWRYMDFSKFIYMLHTDKLFFSRVDKLIDPFEGSSPKEVIKSRKKLLAQIEEDPQYNNNPAKRAEILESYENISDTFAAFTKFTAVNCWHMNSTESMAMWKLYLSSNEGIAIQTTYRRLMNSFNSVEDTINIGLISYIDYDNETFSMLNMDNWFMHKRSCFEYENEIRCLVHKTPNNWRDEPIMNEGVGITIDTDVLIENIYCSPNSPQWFLETVKTTVSKFGKKYTCSESSLATKPNF